MCVCMGMGIVCGNFSALVLDRVRCGLYGSESSVGQPMVRPTATLGVLDYVPVRHSPIPPHPPL